MATKPPETPETPAADPFAALAEPEDHTPSAAEVKVPDAVKAFVDAGHDYWKGHPKKWRSVTLANADLVKSVIKMSRKYASAKGLTFRVNTRDTTETKLVYKVSVKVGTGT